MSDTDKARSEILNNVQDYYGKQLKCTADLKSQACISSGGSNLSTRIKIALSEIHDEIKSRYYGCGQVIPEKLEGMNVLDLGCGSGRDCFAISKLVGQKGHVTGIDMTFELVEVANKYIQYHTEKFGYSEGNVKFANGYIEQLSEAGIEPASMDIIVSNGAVNLCPDKQAVLAEAFRALKVGGELYFSDVYVDRILTDEIRKQKVLWGECISGALWWEELYKFAEAVGFSAPRLVTASPINVDREDFKKVLGDAKFASVTYRLFKLPKERTDSTKVVYNGGITGFEEELDFDHQTHFKKGEITSLDSEMITILQSSRFKDEFDFEPSSISNRCPAISSKVSPFSYLEVREKAGETIAPVCCGTKSC